MANFTVTSLTEYTAIATQMLREGVLFNEDFSIYSLQQGIQHKQYINFIDINPHVQIGACGLSASGTTTITEKEIEVVTYAYRDQFCKETLKEKALMTGVADDDFGTLINENLMAGEIEAIKKQVDTDLWLGTSGMIDGWIENISGCSGAISLDTYSGVTVTTSNIDNVIYDFIDNITDDMWARGVLTIHTSVAIYNMYKRNIIDAYGAGSLSTLLEKMTPMTMWVLGFEGQLLIKAEAALSGTNYMICTWNKNLYIGTDEISNVSEAKWFFDENTDYLRFKANFKLGTQVAFCGEVVHNIY